MQTTTLLKHDNSCLISIEETFACGEIFTQNVQTFISIENTSLEGLCDVVTEIPVEYQVLVCRDEFGIIEEIVISHISFDYDEIAFLCPDINFPNDDALLEVFLIDFEREFSDLVEAQEVIVQMMSNGQVFTCATDGVVNVTRVATSCFQYCWIAPENPMQLYGPSKVICPSDICCFQKQTYCLNSEGELVKNQVKEQWSTGSTCNEEACNDDLSSCAHDCSIVF